MILEVDIDIAIADGSETAQEVEELEGLIAALGQGMEVRAQLPRQRPVHLRNHDFEHDLLAASDLEQVDHLTRLRREIGSNQRERPLHVDGVGHLPAHDDRAAGGLQRD